MFKTALKKAKKFRTKNYFVPLSLLIPLFFFFFTTIFVLINFLFLYLYLGAIATFRLQLLAIASVRYKVKSILILNEYI